MEPLPRQIVYLLVSRYAGATMGAVDGLLYTNWSVPSPATCGTCIRVLILQLIALIFFSCTHSSYCCWCLNPGEGQHSIIELQNVPRLRTACANDSYALAAALVEGFRSGPGETGQGSNLAYVETFKWRGQLYPGTCQGASHLGKVDSSGASLC